MKDTMFTEKQVIRSLKARLRHKVLSKEVTVFFKGNHVNIRKGGKMILTSMEDGIIFYQNGNDQDYTLSLKYETIDFGTNEKCCLYIHTKK